MCSAACTGGLDDVQKGGCGVGGQVAAVQQQHGEARNPVAPIAAGERCIAASCAQPGGRGNEETELVLLANGTTG